MLIIKIQKQNYSLKYLGIYAYFWSINLTAAILCILNQEAFLF